MCLKEEMCSENMVLKCSGLLKLQIFWRKTFPNVATITIIAMQFVTESIIKSLFRIVETEKKRTETKYITKIKPKHFLVKILF